MRATEGAEGPTEVYQRRQGNPSVEPAMQRISRALQSATAANKCRGCGCFHDAVAALGESDLASALADPLEKARATLGERRSECLACDVCWPPDALNAAEESSSSRWVPVVARGSRSVPPADRRSGRPSRRAGCRASGRVHPA